jgi:hypothetical protein
MFEGLRTDEERVKQVVTRLPSYGHPLQAIVHAFGPDERTAVVWQRRAGSHCKRVHKELQLSCNEPERSTRTRLGF